MKLQSPTLTDIKDEFAIAWHDEKKPTIDEFVRRYPEHAEELRKFIQHFVRLSLTSDDDLFVDEIYGHEPMGFDEFE